jgi:hypothetical protein
MPGHRPDQGLLGAGVIFSVRIGAGLGQDLHDALGDQDVLHLIALGILIFLLVECGDVGSQRDKCLSDLQRSEFDGTGLAGHGWVHWRAP